MYQSKNWLLPPLSWCSCFGVAMIWMKYKAVYSPCVALVRARFCLKVSQLTDSFVILWCTQGLLSCQFEIWSYSPWRKTLTSSNIMYVIALVICKENHSFTTTITDTFIKPTNVQYLLLQAIMDNDDCLQCLMKTTGSARNIVINWNTESNSLVNRNGTAASTIITISFTRFYWLSLDSYTANYLHVPSADVGSLSRYFTDVNFDIWTCIF